MDPQQQQHAHMTATAAWSVPHTSYMMPGTPMQQQQVAPPHQAYQQYQHPGMIDPQRPHHLGHTSHSHHVPAPPGIPPHPQGYPMHPSPHDVPRGLSGSGRRSPPPYRGYRDRSYSPPPRHRRTPSPRGHRHSRGYDREMDYPSHRGYDRGYDRGHDRYDFDRGYSNRGYDRGYDRGYGRSYNRDYSRGGYSGRSGYDRGGYGGSRTRSPPRQSRAINRGTEEDRLASRTLYVGNIPYTFREQEVEDMFKKFGTIVKVTVVMDQYTGRNKGFAFVEFDDRKNAEEALENYNGFDVEGRRLKLDWDIGLTKKDIKPPRLTGTTTDHNGTAETSLQPHTRTVTEGSTPVESGVQATSNPSTDIVDHEKNIKSQSNIGTGTSIQEGQQSAEGLTVQGVEDPSKVTEASEQHAVGQSLSEQPDHQQAVGQPSETA